MANRELNKKQPSEQVLAMRQRVQALYRQSSNASNLDQVMNTAFEELALALEQLQAADEGLRQQHDEWQDRYAELELECQRYKDLFEHAPAGYLVTSLDGAIRQANPAAAQLLQSNTRFLVGRSLALFVPEGQRRAFRHSIERLAQAGVPQEWEATLQSWQGAPFDADLTVGVFRGASGRPVALYWLVRDISVRKRAEAALRAGLTLEVPDRPAELNVLDASPSALIKGDISARQQFAFIAEACLQLANAERAYSLSDLTLAEELVRRVTAALEQARASQAALV